MQTENETSLPLTIEEERKLMRKAIKGVSSVNNDLQKLASSLGHMLGALPVNARDKKDEDHSHIVIPHLFDSVGESNTEGGEQP